MFNLALEALDKIKAAIIPSPELAIDGPKINNVCAGCTGACKQNCSNGCKGSCKNSCTRSCKGNSR